MSLVPADVVPMIEEGLREAYRTGGGNAVEDFWREEILGKRMVFNGLLMDFQLSRLLAVTRSITAPQEDIAESNPDHIKSVGHYWIEQVSGPIFAITNDSYVGNGEEFVENEPHEQLIARIARAIIVTTKEIHTNG